MRQVAATTRSWQFALTEQERDFLVAVLESYPVVPLGHQRLNRGFDAGFSPEDEELLQEALREQRATHHELVRRWLAAPRRFHRAKGTLRFRLLKADLNWMLQVLNDVRVGSWLRLGSPGEGHNPFELLHKDPVALFRMEAAGLFEMQFLAAIRHGVDTSGKD